MYHTLKSPMNVQFEITSKCNERCRHCYNYWRRDSSPDSTRNMDKELFDACLDELIKNNVMHVIFTGGEPFFNYDILRYGIERATREGLSTTCNSNLLLASREKLETLRAAGLPHILTSLNSFNAETNDFITSHPGAFDTIVASIREAVAAGIKISTNMIITTNNINDIYETGLFVRDLGVSKFHITRVVPPSYITEADRGEFVQGREELEKVLEQTVALERDSDIEVKTLIPYPLCALGDLDRFRKYIGRPCAAGKRSMSIDSNGLGHACWHMTREYGSVPEKGLAQVWADMQEWRSGELIPDACKPCPHLPLCGAGCRVAGAQFFGELSAEDNLRRGWEHVVAPYTGTIGVDDSKRPFAEIAALYAPSCTPEVYEKVRTRPMRVRSGVRIRPEEGFSVVNLIAGTGFFLVQDKADKLIPFLNGSSFSLADLGGDEQFAAYLLVKGVVETA